MACRFQPDRDRGCRLSGCERADCVVYTGREVAAAVLWLSSPDASFVTGTDLEVDGGLGAFGAFAEPYRIETLRERPS